MGLEPFQFKQFAVNHDLCTHKVGTDGVLLGAWVRIFKDEREMLDVGTGSGLIALMLAQRTPAGSHIDAIDIEAADVLQASKNAQHSPWKDRINVVHSALQLFTPGKKYDLIVANPPYFSNSLLPADKRRGQARHTGSLPYGDLLQHGDRLLTTSGRLAVILPYADGLNFIELAKIHGLFPVRKTRFRSRVHKQPERLLLELAFAGPAEPDTDLVLHGEGEKWSKEYVALTREFYVKL